LAGRRGAGGSATVSINGTEYAGDIVSQGAYSSGLNAYLLAGNAEGGAVLDLNGHQLTVKDVVCDDYLGAMITNSASNKAVLIFTGEPSVSKAVTVGLVKEVGTKILLAKAGELSATWTGAADGVSANKAGNGTLTVVGTPEAVNLPSGWKISASSSGAKVQKVGFTIYVR